MIIDVDQAMTFMLVMLRMTGMLLFNPILGRRNIPVMANAGLAFVLAALLMGVVTPAPVDDITIPALLLLVVKELFVGFVAGVLFQMILSILIVGGEVIDLQLGISMSKAFDPSTNASISVTAGLLNAMFLLIFFTTDNHLTFIRLITITFDILPVGDFAVNPEIYLFLPELFSTILVFAIKLCLPVVVIELVVTMAVGIIMRIIPQINVFVVNIQFKLIIGIFSLIILVGPLVAYFGNLIQISFEQLEEALLLLMAA
jgi:flagellar biosynthetic protein FliR